MILSYSKRFFIVHLEKTGGTSIREAIAPHLEPYDLVMSNWDKYVFNSAQDWLWEHTDAETICKFLGPSAGMYKRFSTVRDPVQILKSAYKYGRNTYNSQFRDVSDIAHIPPDGVLKAYLYSEKTGEGPDAFVEYMLARGFGTVLPQVVRLNGPDGFFIVDMSVLDNMWPIVLDYLDLDQSIKLGHSNVSNSSDIELSATSIGLIKRHFAIDYKILPSITGIDWE